MNNFKFVRASSSVLYACLWFLSWAVILFLLVQLKRSHVNSIEILLFVGSFLLLFFVGPGPLLQFDEFFHTDAVENVPKYSLPYLCYVVQSGECVLAGEVWWPPMFYALSTIPSSFFGSLWGATVTNLVLSAFSSVLVYKIGKILIKDEVLALLLSSTLLFNPILLKFARSAIIDITFMFFALLYIYYLLVIESGNSGKEIWGLILSVVALSLTKIEASVVAVIFLVYSFIKFRKRAPWGPFLLGSVLLLGPVKHSFNVRNGLERGVIFTTEKLIKNLSFFVNPAFVNPFFTLLSLFGLKTSNRHAKFFAFLTIFMVAFDTCFSEYPYASPGFSRLYLRVIPYMLVLLAYSIRKFDSAWPVLLLLPVNLLSSRAMIYEKVVGGYEVMSANKDVLVKFSNNTFVYDEAAVIRRLLPNASVCSIYAVEYCQNKSMVVLSDRFTSQVFDRLEGCYKEKIGDMYSNEYKIEIFRVNCSRYNADR